MDPSVFFKNYTPVGDNVVLSVCLVFFVLFRTAFISRTKSFSLFLRMLFALLASAVSILLFHTLSDVLPIEYSWLLSLLWFCHVVSIFATFVCYIYYILESFRIPKKQAGIHKIIALSAFGVIALYELLGMIFKFGFYYTEEGTLHPGMYFFVLAYYLFVGYAIYLLIRYRKQIYKQIVKGLVSVWFISILVMIIQGFSAQISFTTSTLLLPMIALLYLIHSNPYDVELGTVDITAFEDTISYSHSKKIRLVLMSCFMHDFEGGGKKYPKDIHDMIRHFMEGYFKSAALFQIAGGHIMLAAPIDKNPDWQLISDRMIDDFYALYDRYQYDYKIVVMTSTDSLSENNDYLGFIRNVESIMPENSVHFVEDSDIVAYYDQKYILSELEEIQRKNDLEDERVLVYCQPVLNLANGKYDTAEALMRLKLHEKGVVFPDRFVPLAEKFGYVHAITRVILYKTCLEIKKLIEEGYQVKRISVNVAADEMRSIDFSRDIIKVIARSGIPFEKIAIEVTESQNESDFKVVKQIIEELKGNGIKFYLDDFGTGYSNFERIMELPFDIIKFDRSLVLASGADAKFEMMVSHLSRMFSDLNYSILYEGIENDRDENMCRSMSARYLQGYKYSKPVPIAELRNFFKKTEQEAL